MPALAWEVEDAPEGMFRDDASWEKPSAPVDTEAQQFRDDMDTEPEVPLPEQEIPLAEPEDGEKLDPLEQLPEAIAAETPPADMEVGPYTVPSAAPGEALTLAVPLDHFLGEALYRSNVDADGEIIPYDPDGEPDGYDQSIADVLLEASVTIVGEQGTSPALDFGSLYQTSPLLQDGENLGYALFEGLRLMEDAEPGLHTVRLYVAWRGHDDIERDKLLLVRVEVEEPAGEAMEPEAAAPGDVTLGGYARPAAEPGERLTLAIPLRYEGAGWAYATNADEAGRAAPYDAGPAAFDQAVTEALEALEVTIAVYQPEGFPLDDHALSQVRRVVSGGENRGYAVFEDLRIRDDAMAGIFPVHLQVTWQEVGGGWHSKVVECEVEIVGVPARAPGDVAIGTHTPPSARPGGTLTLAVPIAYTREENTYETHAGAGGGLVPHDGAPATQPFDQAVTGEVEALRVAIDPRQAEGTPLALEAPQAQRSIVDGGENLGYALFEDLPIPMDAAPGQYSVRVEVSWLETGDTGWQSRTLAVPFLVEGAAYEGAMLGACPPFRAPPGGGAVSLAIPISYRTWDEQYIESRYDTNERDGRVVPYAPESAPGDYDQGIAAMLAQMTVTIPRDQGPDCPLDILALPQQRTVIGDGVNSGYAVFESLPLIVDAEGTFPIELVVSWVGMDGVSQTRDLTIYLNLTSEGAMRYGANGIIVFTHAQLKAALQGTAYDPVYLGYCDTDMPADAWETRNGGVIEYPGDGASGIAISRDVTIIGTDPRSRRRVTLVDRPRAFGRDPARDGMYINSACTVYLEDVDVVGNSCSGILSSFATGGRAWFVGVNYTGCRLFSTAASGNSVRLSGCDVTIDSMGTDGSRAQEAVRLGGNGEVHLYGGNTLRRVGGSISTHEYPIIWFASTPGTIRVHEGAQVTVEANNYFLYEGSGATLIVDGVLDLTTQGASGCVTYGGDGLVACTVGGTLTIRHRNTNTQWPSLRTKRLNVTGSLHIEKSRSLSPCVMISGGGTATFASARSVTLQNTAGMIMRAQDATATVTITTQALNLYNGSVRHRWNNNDLRPFTVITSLSTSGSQSVSLSGLASYRGVALGAQTLNTGTYNYTNAWVIAFGQYSASLDADTLYLGSDVVRGSAPAGSTQVIEEYRTTGGSLGTRIQSAAATGSTRFRTGDGWSPISTATSRVYLLSTLGQLEVHIYRDTGEVCYLRSVPAEVDFGTVPVGGDRRWVYRESPKDWVVQVVDTRRTGNWTLRASATALTAEDGSDALPEALVFVRPDDTWTPLSGTAVTVAQKGSSDAPGTANIVWPQEGGLCILLEPYEGQAGKDYSATITWTLVIE